MTKSLSAVKIFCLLILLSSFLFPQQIKMKESYILEKRIVIPGEEYKAGHLHEIFFGRHWRDLWTTPITVPVINLDTFEGGITPSERGGGQQTKSLRFKNKSGVEYKFRSINKDPKGALPEELQESFAADVLKDQISSANPLAALVVVPILNAEGILYAEPIVCILPDDEKLGEYRKEFGGMLGTMEIHPDVDEDKNVAFEDADKIEGTFKLLDRLEKDNDEFINAAEYLKARLIDMFVGDWDRHTDQWRWARYKVNGRKVWYPIPRDRDQAFSKYDGLFPWITAVSIPQIEHFSDTYPEIEDLTWSGRQLDRRILPQLTKSEWDSVTSFVLVRLTDSLIEYSVKRLPEEMYNIAGAELIHDLKSRRDNLKEASEIFFENTLSYVDIRGSNKDESLVVNRIDDHNVEVSLFDVDKDTGGSDELLFHRIFSDDYTKEIRVMLYGGDDKAVVRGNVNSSIPVYIAGDEGKDILIDSSFVDGYFLGIVPFIPSDERATYFYDDGKKTDFILGPGTSIRTKKLPEPKDDFEKYEPQLRTWGHDWSFGPWLGINPDDGLFIGGGPVLYDYGFRTDPYVYRMELAAGIATTTLQYKARYAGEFYSILEHNKILLEIRSSGLEISNYYGLGNNTTRLESLEHKDYYKANQQQFLVSPKIEFILDNDIRLYLGYRIMYTDTDLKMNTLINQVQPYGSLSNMITHSFSAEMKYDTRDNTALTTKGFLLNAGAISYPSFSRDKSAYAKVKGNISAYLPLFSLQYSSIAVRAGGEKIWGKFPFFESAFLGGIESLRGFDRNRFAGDASVFANAELRLLIAQFKLLIPVYLGTAFFTDAGRVFMQGEQSEKWHKSVGIGLWAALINTDILFSAYAALSDDDEGFYANVGFAF